MVKCKVCGTEIPKGFLSCPKCGSPAKPSVTRGKPSFTEDDVKWLAKLIDEKGDMGWTVNERGEVEPYIKIMSEDEEEVERAARLMKEMSETPRSRRHPRSRRKT